MKGCELCDQVARMYCESDQASLCWDCDAKVHGANFLVARHSRILLCRNCQSPTPWRAAGTRLGSTVSVCEGCVGRGGGRKGKREVGEIEGAYGLEEEMEEGGEDAEEVEEEEIEQEEEEEEEGEEGEEEEEEGDGDNQVVPWSSTPPPTASSSSSEESSSRICSGFLKRMRENVDLASQPSLQDHLPCSSAYIAANSALPLPGRTSAEEEVTSNSFRPSKDRKKVEISCSASPEVAANLDIFNRRDHAAADLVASGPHGPPM